MNKFLFQTGVLMMTTMIFLAGCSSAINFTTDLTIGEGSGKGEVESHGIKSFEKGQFEKVDVQTDAMNIMIQQGSSNEATVELLTDNTISSEITFDASIQGDVLQVTVNEKDVSMKNNSGERKLIIMLPDEAQLDMNVVNAFGEIVIEEVALGQAHLEQNAGNVHAKDVAGNLDILVNAGEINIERAHSEFAIGARVDAGNINIGYKEVPQAAKFDLSSEVGSVKLALDQVEYDVNNKTTIKGNRGSDGPLVKAVTSVGTINVGVK